MSAARKPCHIQRAIRRPYATTVSCACGWVQVVFHRNALARNSRADAAENRHLKLHAVEVKS